MLGLLSCNCIMCLESLEMLENDKRVKKGNFWGTFGGGRGGHEFFRLPCVSFISTKKIAHVHALTDLQINLFMILVLNFFLDLFISFFEKLIF